MSTIDDELKEMFQQCPILLDERFQSEHPGIVGVAAFLDASAKNFYRLTGKFDPFDRVGVKNIQDYIRLVEQGNIEALRIYERARDILCLE